MDTVSTETAKPHGEPHPIIDARTGLPLTRADFEVENVVTGTRRRRRRYESVNAIGLPRTKLNDREALKAAKKLYLLGRKLVDRPYPRKQLGSLQLKIMYGNLRTYIHRGRVNPCHGWWGLVHDISHDIENGHSPKHEWLERQLAEYVRDQGWIDGKLRPAEKPKVDPKQVRYRRVLARLDAWQRKLKRAETAIKKLQRQKAYYERESA